MLFLKEAEFSCKIAASGTSHCVGTSSFFHRNSWFYHVETLDTKWDLLVNRPDSNRLVTLNSLSSHRSCLWSHLYSKASTSSLLLCAGYLHLQNLDSLLWNPNFLANPSLESVLGQGLFLTGKRYSRDNVVMLGSSLRGNFCQWSWLSQVPIFPGMNI